MDTHSTPIDRHVSFEPIDPEPTNSVDPVGETRTLRFAIVPPIDVHDPTFLNKAIKRELANADPYDDNATLLRGADVTHSDELATYGTIRVDASTQDKVDRLPTELEAFVGQQINPLGHTALTFSYDLGTHA